MDGPRSAAPEASDASPFQSAAEVAGSVATTLGGLATAVEKSVTPDRTEERRETATTALEGVSDQEAREAVDLARKAFPEGPEGQ
jgi:hypothetical protein